MDDSSRSTATVVLMSEHAWEEQFDADRQQRLRELTGTSELQWAPDPDDARVSARLADASVLLTGWGAPELTPDLLEKMPRLRVVIHCAGSIRTIVSPELWHRGIQVTNCADANAEPVAEFTVAAVIMAGKKAPFAAAELRNTRDGRSRTRAFGPITNGGVTIGLVGFSRIGRRVAALLPLVLREVTVLVADPYADRAAVEAAGAELVPLDEMLPRLDVLSIHAPQLPSTRHMIAATQLAALPDHTTVINTARGSLIDTEALTAECHSGRLNALLDVTDPEPLPADSPLYDLPNVMVTPHVAGSQGTEMLRMTDSALDELERWLKGELLQHAVSETEMTISA